MKKLMCAWLALMMALACVIPALGEEAPNLLLNGDFSEIEDGGPAHWRQDMWLKDGASVLALDPEGYDGEAVYVRNLQANDARYAQTVAVEPDTVYRVSAKVRASGCDSEGRAANLSVEGLNCYSESLFDTRGEWRDLTLVGLTGPEQREVTVFLRVGGYSALSTGEAWFDDVEMVRLDEVPADATVQNFFQNASAASRSAPARSDAEPTRYTETLLLFICVYAAAVLGFTRKRGRAPISSRKPVWSIALIAGLAAAFILRLAVATRIRGYNVDVNDFMLWSERMFTAGPARFYETWCDYPPGYMLLLWLVAALRRLLRLETDAAAYLALLKLIPMVCDILSALLVWHIARRRFSERAASALAMFIALDPAAIANSAAWGQIDSVLTLLVALCAVAAADGRYTAALLWFGAAMLVKPQALLFAPLGLAAIVFGLIRAGDKRAERLRAALIGVAACLGLLYAAGFIMCVGQARNAGDALARPISWLFELYSGTMQHYDYISVNTLNLHYLFHFNWARLQDHPGYAGLTWALFALSYGFAVAMMGFGSKKPRRIFLTGGALILMICTFGPMIHERYMYPALLLLAVAFACEKDRRLLIAATVVSCTLFMNQALVLQGGMTSANYGHLQEKERWLNDIVSIVNVLNALFVGWTTYDICVLNHVHAMRALPSEDAPAGVVTLNEPANWRLNLTRVDALLMAGVTLVYSAVAFVNLGVTRAPQTGWTSSAAGEAVVFDLGVSQPFRMTYYGGICANHFGVELSNDGEHWSDKVWAKYDDGEIFRWIWFQPYDNSPKPQSLLLEDTVPSEDGSAYIVYAGGGDSFPMQTARYVRITAESAGLVLFEVGFLDENSEALPVYGVDQSGQDGAAAASAALLVDEQDTVAAYPSYLNSSYFDEIYHARTAYEQLHDMNAFEWSHPPLGKAMMEIGIALFGMTPFGWRFMGTLMGVLMLPLIYLMVKQLTKDTRLSFIAMALLALDSMHFTQTRIATIDSYAVFWIMLMYLFMFRYCQMSWNRESLGRTLVPLGLCGVTMGVAWATKWIGIYASAGLAILFFWTILRRVREGVAARDGAGTARCVILTGLFCVAFFIVIPALIYYLSYYFFLRGDNLTPVKSLWDMFALKPLEAGAPLRSVFYGTPFERVFELQRSIFNYHAGLGGDTHYFRSPWYQWPVIWWPMWYYDGTSYMPPETISSISCMGNPAVWWFGLAALIFVIVRMCALRRAPKRYMMVVIAFASQFLPWVIVPRSTFIYHYFASVPSIIIASVLLLDWIREKNDTAFLLTSSILLTSALVLFAMFYPLESGLPVSYEYAQHLRWFKWYNFRLLH